MKRRIFVLFFLFFAVAISLVLLYFLKPNVSSYAIVAKSYFTFLLIFCVPFITLYLARIISEREEKKSYENLYNLPKPFLHHIHELYCLLEECSRKGYDLDKTLNKVYNIVSKIVKKYSNVLHNLPEHIKLPFYNIVFSVEGAHQHYYIKRMEKDLRDLRIAVKEIIEKTRDLYLERY
jgi:hypothetical protein